MRTGDETLRPLITTSLDAMACGGMYDHIGGGFSRYSVDERWLVPHFEKMLYDQALLARTYVHAWKALGHARYFQVASETIDYVLAYMRHPSGGFFSAEDADSMTPSGHSEEGAFYTWTPAEMDEVLGEWSTDAAAFWASPKEGTSRAGRYRTGSMHGPTSDGPMQSSVADGHSCPRATNARGRDWTTRC